MAQVLPRFGFVVYIAVSTLLMAGVVLLAMIERTNFYSACVSISQSGASAIIVVNMILVISLVVGKTTQVVFFGQLRALELDHLQEKLWFTVVETGMVMAMFKDSFSYSFFTLFTVLMFFRVFHWIASDRVDLIFQTIHRPTAVAKLRLASALVMLTVSDYYLLKWCVLDAMNQGMDISLIFAFEYALLMNTLFSIVGRYGLNLIEASFLDQNQEEDNWELKGTCMFFLETTSDFLRLCLHACLFCVMLKPYGPPIHRIRDVYVTTVSLFTRIRDYVRFKRARNQMDRAIANATQEELDRQEDICIICREELNMVDNPARLVPKKLACGHVIHYGCLKSWLERSQNCPTCRQAVMPETPQTQPQQPEVQQPQPQAPQVPQAPQAASAPTPTPTQPVPATAGATRGIVMPNGFQLPVGWTSLEARESSTGGIREVKLSGDTWATITDADISLDDIPDGPSPPPGPAKPTNRPSTKEELARLSGSVDTLIESQSKIAGSVDEMRELLVQVQRQNQELASIVNTMSGSKGKEKVEYE